MTEQVAIKVRIATDNVGSECTDTLIFDADVWARMSEEEREAEAREAAFNMMEWGYTVTDADGNEVQE